MLKKLFVLALLLGQPVQASTAVATIYAKYYDGRPTASGKIFRYLGRSAAHPNLPYGRYIVRYRDRQVEVELNDRLFLDRLDLSCGAALELFGHCRDFKVTVQYERVR